MTGPELIAALERQTAETERFLGTLSTDVFLAPQGDAWSPAEHVRHLLKSIAPVVRALGLPRPLLGLLFGVARTESRSFEKMRTDYLETLSRGGTAGKFTPSKEVVPDDREAYRRRVMASFRTVSEDLARAVALWDERALSRYRLPHPLLGKLTVREMLLFTLYHGEHHVSRVRQRVL